MADIFGRSTAPAHVPPVAEKIIAALGLTGLISRVVIDIRADTLTPIVFVERHPSPAENEKLAAAFEGAADDVIVVDASSERLNDVVESAMRDAWEGRYGPAQGPEVRDAAAALLESRRER